MLQDPDPGASAQLQIGDYLSVFTRRAWFIVIPFVLVLVISGALAFLLPTEYQASVSAKVLDQGFLDDFYDRGIVKIEHKPLLKTVTQDIKNRGFLEPIIQEFKINEGFNTDDPREFRLLLEKVIKKNLKIALVSQDEGPDLVRMVYQGRDSLKVCQFVLAVYRKYSEHFIGRYRDLISRGREQLVKQYRSADNRYRAAAEELRKWQIRNNLIDAGPGTYISELKSFAEAKKERSARRRELKGLEERLDIIISQLRSESPTDETIRQETNPLYIEQAQKVKLLEDHLKGLKKEFKDTWPAVQMAKAALEKARSVLKDIPPREATSIEVQPSSVWNDLTSTKAEVQGQITALRAEIEELDLQIAAQQERVDQLPDLLKAHEDLAKAKDGAARDKESIGFAKDRAEATWNRAISGGKDAFFHLLSSPALDEHRSLDPVFPKVGLFLGVGGFMGLLIGCGLAFLMEFTSQSFVTVRQVQRSLSLPVLGQVAPIRTSHEQRRQIFRRSMIGLVALVIIGALTYAHVCYFNREMQQYLPTWLFDILKRIYGNR